MSVTYPVKNLMIEDIASVESSVALSEAMKLMVERDIGSVVVTRKGEMVGILTERDVMKKFCFDSECALLKVGEVMSTPLISVEGKMSIGEAMSVMSEKKIRRLLVTEERKIRGIITETDLMRKTLEVFKKLSDAWV
jgi:signal-transduction protein with cAMP-binding, CBS, and nucleotidyltransferase domain